jgi:acyl-CoA synthetase (AMP-forming)/AMP-acid ligase II
MQLNQDIANATAWSVWSGIAQKYPDREAIIHRVTGDGPVRWTYKNLLYAANKFSLLLKTKGVKPNEVCALIIRHNPYFYPIYMGVVGIGALPAVLAYPNPRLHPEKFREGLAGMSERSGLDWILTEKSLEEIIRPFSSRKESTINDLLFPLEWSLDTADDDNLQKEIDKTRREIDPNSPLLLQHSSGTTGLQKPVVLSHKAVIAHVKYYGDALKLNENDKVVSWLPLYHDMGLIAAYHMPLLFGIPGVQLDPFEWVVAPSILCDAISTEKATLGWLPNFAYNFMADRIDDDELEGVSFKSIRLLINCSEPVRAESHHKFYERFSKYELDKNSLSACYAMAETTYAVSQTEVGVFPREIVVDRNALGEGVLKLADEKSVSRTCVSSGKLIEGCEVRIVDDLRKVLPEDEVGEIAVRSVSLFDGYRNYPEKTAQALDGEGWFYTGDYGFMYEDELYVIGRKKDIIIEAGNNIYPEDVEDALNKVEGVIPGRVIAFGEEDEELGTEHVSVVAETKVEKDKHHNLKLAIVKAGMGINVNIKEVYLVPSRWLIKSSSGKPSRKANKHRIKNKEFNQAWS